MIANKRANEVIEIETVRKKEMTVDQMKEHCKDLKKVSHSSASKQHIKNITLKRKIQKFLVVMEKVLDELESTYDENDPEKVQRIFKTGLQAFSDHIGSIEELENYDTCVMLLKPYVNNDVLRTKELLQFAVDVVKKQSRYRRMKGMFYSFFLTLRKWLP